MLSMLHAAIVDGDKTMLTIEMRVHCILNADAINCVASKSCPGTQPDHRIMRNVHQRAHLHCCNTRHQEHCEALSRGCFRHFSPHDDACAIASTTMGHDEPFYPAAAHQPYIELTLVTLEETDQQVD
eukprot:TRINITY_DN12485_c0_g3_i8.p1 TRINITY_DN12485_c0_g3~~TRINITY_DN12485_c0_g3_i8.p1  ORF type:complete len:127 (+),score=17.91 TRINITY_DN12485_c0_g3_i8:257-637(+)